MSKKGGSLKTLGIVLPGDEVLQINSNEIRGEIFLGPGLRMHENIVYATCSGPLMKTTQNVYYVDNYQKRYIPHKGQFVVGIVLKKKGGNYIIDIGGSQYAVLSLMCFENVAKKAKKEIRPGELIFGQLLVADKDMEPELVCIDVSNDAVGIAALPEGGIMFTVPLQVTRVLLEPQNSLLKKISKRLKYTLVVGSNGRVWVMSEGQREALAIMSCLKMLEVFTQQEAEQNLYKYLDQFESQL